jgi:hypothetical protein
MLPVLVVGGIIGAVVSAIQGYSWISDQIGPSNAASVGGKDAPKSSAEATASPFETTLAAQVAGQSVPATPDTVAAAVTSPDPSASLLPMTHGTDYDALARMQAGITAYSHIGEHRSNHPGSAKPQGTAADGSISP